MNKLFIKDYERIVSKKYKLFPFIYNFIKYHQIRFLYFYRTQNKFMLRRYKLKYGIEIYTKRIGEGLFLGHAFNITINEKATIGSYCHIHKGVTIGQENRGQRKGTPTIRK